MPSGVSDGSNSRPLNDTVAETGPGIADDAVVNGELNPGKLGAGSDAAVEKLQAAGWTKPAEATAEDETEAHPS